VKFAPIEGSGAVEVAVSPATAFAYLADPRHAPEWFAGATFDSPPQGAPRLGQSWTFARTRGTRRVLPVEIAAFEPPRHFLWQTTLGPRRDNNAWEVACASAAAGATRLTRLTVTIRLIPGPLGWLSILLYRPLVRAALRERAQRAANRARDALLAHVAPSSSSSPPPARPHSRSGRKPRRPRR